MAVTAARQRWLDAHREELRAYHVAWSKANPDKIRGYAAAYDPEDKKEWDRKKGRKYRAAHPEKVREWSRKAQQKLRAERPEVSRQRLREWKRKNPDKVKVLTKRYAETHREHLLAKSRAYVARNKDKVAMTGKKWREDNHEKWLRRSVVDGERRRARKRSAPGAGVTRDQWLAIQDEYGHRCAYCAAQTKLAMDHVRPLSKGGAHDVFNIVPACRSCNSSKRDRNILQWLASRAVAA